jgi:hypothetical protein
MNAINSTPETTPPRQKGSKMKVRIAVSKTRKKEIKFSVLPITVSLITVKGTPDRQEHTKTGDNHAQQQSDSELSLYYKVFNRYKPEPGESNAESVARTIAFEAEYNYLLMKSRAKTNQTSKGREQIETRLILFPYPTAIFKRAKDKAYQNNVQEIPLDTDYYLYNNPEQIIKSQPLNIIYDTGAAISMLPADYAHAWTNLRQCLHTLTGCFSGHSESNLMIGEFHGIITLDSQETIRVIIPECIQIPQGLSNTYLLSDSAFLMAGHAYVSHLSKPKLRLNGGGTYTMSVTRGHKLITVMPTHAEEDTPHRTVYLHSNETL